MSSDEHNFLRRWSRLKRQPPEVSVAPAELPALEALTYESDFGAFMRAKVDEGVKRAALKKLFSDPRFNVMDGLDVYIDDYSIEDPIPPGMLAQLQHARTTLFGPPADEKSEEEAKPEEQAGTPPQPPSSNEPSPEH
jgi:hypothetical protein